MCESLRALQRDLQSAADALAALAKNDAQIALGLALVYRIQHILLDEFQDTSYTQFELLDRLIETWDPGDGRTPPPLSRAETAAQMKIWVEGSAACPQ